MGFCIESTSQLDSDDQQQQRRATTLAAADERVYDDDHHFRCNDHEKLMKFMRDIVFGKHEMI
jgi:hypothetical protein